LTVLRFGIIGMGKMGRIRAREIQARADSKLIAVCDANARSSVEMEGVRCFREANDLLSLDLDAVMICAYNNAAAPLTLAALQAGKHVLCEKPPARFASELEDVSRFASKTDLVVKYGFNHRYHYSVIEAKKLAGRKALGELLWIKGTYGKAGGEKYESEWRNDLKLSGGGILIDQGIHMLDLMMTFGGRVERASSLIHARYWQASVEDNVFAVLEGEGGIPMMLHSSAVLWRHKFLLELCFAEGLLALDGILSSTGSYADERLIVMHRETGGSALALGKPREERMTFGKDHSWKLELEEFVQAIRGNASISNGSISDSLKLMQAVEAIYESSGFYREAGR
jgi:predicted dehydrogenase